MTNETTFENVKVNDKVYSLGLGWGRVTDIYLCSFYGLIYFSVQFASGKVNYLPSGVVSTGCGVAVNQTLFWDEVKIVAPVKPKVAPPVDTLMNVWSHPDHKWKRYSTGKFASDGRLLVFNDGATSKSASDPSRVFATDNWEVVQ